MFLIHRKKKNSAIKITGTSSYIEVEIDNKLIRIPGEMGDGYFLCYEECIKEWLTPEGQIVTPEEKENLITRINEKQKKSSMKIVFKDNKKNEESENAVEEEKKLPEEESEEALGWKAIENEFLRIYKNQTNPKHYGTLIKWCLGGNDPLDGISIYEGNDYWHFVSFGLTELYKKESENMEVSGFGYELTFKLKKTNYQNQEAEFTNICSILQSIARLVFNNGEVFLPDEYIYTGQTQGIDAYQKSNLTGFILIKDTTVETINTPYGKVNFLEVIGMTDAELKSLSTKESVQNMYKKLSSDITDYNRESII